MINISIQEEMALVHKKIGTLLNKAVDSFGLSKKESIAVFNDFKDSLLNHIDIEEKVIFSSADLGDAQIQTMTRKLCDEHQLMRVMIAEAEKDIKNDQKVEIVRFMSLLKSHHAAEDKILYPKLDSILSLSEKIRIRNEMDKR